MVIRARVEAARRIASTARVHPQIRQHLFPQAIEVGQHFLDASATTANRTEYHRTMLSVLGVDHPSQQLLRELEAPAAGPVIEPYPDVWHELVTTRFVVVGMLLGMTSYQPTAVSHISPAKLAIAGAVAFVLSVALIVGGAGFFAAISAPVVVFASTLGRVLFVASVVLVVLAVVRRLDRR